MCMMLLICVFSITHLNFVGNLTIEICYEVSGWFIENMLYSIKLFLNILLKCSYIYIYISIYTM